MASSSKRSSPDIAFAAAGAKRLILISIREEEQLPYSESSDICTYWSAYPAFDHKRVLIWRMLFINENKTKYVSIIFYPARDYQPLVEFGAIRRGGSNSLILTDEKVATLVGCLLAISDSMCFGGNRVVIKCE